MSLASRSRIEDGELDRDLLERLHRLRIKETGFGRGRLLVHASDPVNAAPYCILIQQFARPIGGIRRTVTRTIFDGAVSYVSC